MRMVFYILIINLITSCDYYVVNPYKHPIGHLSESNIGNPDFEPCYKEEIFAGNYFRKPSGFSFGKDSLRRYFSSTYDNQGIVSESGYITFRFAINCEGEKGWYEIHELGLDFKEKKFNKITVDHLLKLIEDLDSWRPIEFNDNKFDSYMHLTFKIENGDLLEILP